MSWLTSCVHCALDASPRGKGYGRRRVHSQTGGAHVDKAVCGPCQRSDGSFPLCTGNRVGSRCVKYLRTSTTTSRWSVDGVEGLRPHFTEFDVVTLYNLSCKSPLACLPEKALPSRLRTQCTLRLPRLLRNTQAPLRTTVSSFESSEIRAPELIGFVCKVKHPSEAVDVSVFWVLLSLLMPLGFTSLVHACCTASDG